MLSLSPCFTQSSTDSYDNVVMKHLLRLFLLRLKGFRPKSLCTAFYCSNIGLQHETLLLYCQLLLWEKLLDWFFFSTLDRFEMKTTDVHISFPFISSMFCSHWLHLPVWMKFTLIISTDLAPPPAYDAQSPGPSSASAPEPGPSNSSSSSSRHRRTRRPHRSSGTRDERYRSG